MAKWDQIADVVIVGSGAAGLTAALAARANGLDPLVVERGTLVGGSSALAGGGMWIPANRFMLADGSRDTPEAALEYLEALIGEGTRASSRSRREGFVRNAPRAVMLLESCGLAFRRTTGYPDYHPDRPGASTEGRGIESVIFDTNRLGRWSERLPRRVFPRNLPMGTLDVAQVTLARRTLPGFTRYSRILAHHAISRLRGERLIGGGGALVAQLLHAVLGDGTPIWTESRALELVVEGEVITGVIVERQRHKRQIRARHAVLLGAGGFARNDEMRGRYHPQPARAQWSSSNPLDLGDGIRIGQEAGAALELMDEVWGGPASFDPLSERAIFHVSERSKPGSLIVDGSGERYLNEAKSYVEAVHDMYARNRERPAIPSWLLFDSTYRNRYPFGTMLPMRTPKSAIESGYLKRASTIAALAAEIGTDSGTLVRTVERFNRFARRGVDEDFHRGENAYDTYYGDPRVRPNSCLAPLERAPFYATALYPGDLGTKGGLLTDEAGRVLRPDGSTITGLYASGNTTASVMGAYYPGPGVTLAPAITFSYLAMANAAARAHEDQPRPRSIFAAA